MTNLSLITNIIQKAKKRESKFNIRNNKNCRHENKSSKKIKKIIFYVTLKKKKENTEAESHIWIYLTG